MIKKIGCLHIVAIVVMLFLADQFFNYYWQQFIYVLLAGIGLVLLIFLIDKLPRYRHRNNKLKAIDISAQDHLASQEHMSFDKAPVRRHDQLLSNSELGYLCNVLLDIKEVETQTILDVQNSVEPVDLGSLRKEYKSAILYDISQIPMFLVFDIHESPAQRNILLAAFGFFSLDEQNFNELVQYKTRLDEVSKAFLGKMNSPIGYNYTEPIIGMELFSNYKKQYLDSLIEIVKLVATMDYQLFAKEKKGMKFYTEYKM